MTYQDQLEETATATASQVLAAVAMYEAGAMSAEALTAVVAAYIAAGNSAAAALADLSLSAALTVQTRTPVIPMGITRPTDDVERLTKAATTLLTDDTKTTTARWERLATAEVKEAAARAYSTAVAVSPFVKGWIRGIDEDPCQLCTWWYRDGRVWPASHEMPTHKGCTCNPIPVLVDWIKPVRHH